MTPLGSSSWELKLSLVPLTCELNRPALCERTKAYHSGLHRAAAGSVCVK